MISPIFIKPSTLRNDLPTESLNALTPKQFKLGIMHFDRLFPQLKQTHSKTILTLHSWLRRYSYVKTKWAFGCILQVVGLQRGGFYPQGCIV